MFENNTGITGCIPHNIFSSCKDTLTDASYMFKGCIGLNGIDRDILNICINRNNINEKATIELENLYKMLIQWSSDNIKMFS